jgi:hypothetical protein
MTHLHRMGDTAIIGPAWGRKVGDRVRLPDGSVVVVQDYDQKIPADFPCPPGLRKITEDGSTFITDGLYRAVPAETAAA